METEIKDIITTEIQELPAIQAVLNSLKPKKKKDPKYNNSPEYNKTYYSKHKQEILDMLKVKCICELCGRETTYQRMKYHKTTTLCKKNRKPI